MSGNGNGKIAIVAADVHHVIGLMRSRKNPGAAVSSALPELVRRHGAHHILNAIDEFVKSDWTLALAWADARFKQARVSMFTEARRLEKLLGKSIDPMSYGSTNEDD